MKIADKVIVSKKCARRHCSDYRKIKFYYPKLETDSPIVPILYYNKSVGLVEGVASNIVYVRFHLTDYRCIFGFRDEDLELVVG